MVAKSPLWLSELSKDWKAKHSGRLEEHLNWYRSANDLTEAVARAARADHDKEGTKHSHQRRMTKATAKDLRKFLCNRIGTLNAAQSFEEVYRCIEPAARSLGEHKVSGCGPLLLNDTSLSIGVFLGFAPDRIYTQSGAFAGARALVKRLELRTKVVDGGSLSMADIGGFCETLNLMPYEMEHFLCVCKESIRLGGSRTAQKASANRMMC